VLAVVAQFLYVAAQAGIFSFFINYMTTQVPPIPVAWREGWLANWLEPGAAGALRLTDQGAAGIASLGLVCFLAGRFSGAGILRTFSAHKVLGFYGAMNVIMCALVALKLGWLSVACVFLIYFFMSIMFPTIFASSIRGLGPLVKPGASLLIMAIIGGAVMAPVMGWLADVAHSMQFAMMAPALCFVVVLGFALSGRRAPAAERQAAQA
jgi:FHS family L-fucose permease-like MFS transporter